jgi:hypothetical protein
MLTKFRDEDGHAVFFDVRDVVRIWGGGGNWKGKMTIVSFGGTSQLCVRGHVNRVGPRIKRLQDKAAQVAVEPAK